MKLTSLGYREEFCERLTLQNAVATESIEWTVRTTFSSLEVSRPDAIYPALRIN